MTSNWALLGWVGAVGAGLASAGSLAHAQGGAAAPAPAPATSTTAAPLATTPAPAPGPGAPALTDGGYLQKVNAIYQGRDRAVPDDLRADLVLLPAIAAMDKAPEWLAPLNAALITPRSKDWSSVDAWASGEKQQAALEAYKKVTESGKRFAFNQGYGRDAADPAIRASGLYTEVGEPAVLAAARFNYLPGLDRLCALVQVEATRLAEAKKGKDAADLLVRWVVFGRMLADREFATEKAWGGHAMLEGLERLRDVVRNYAQDMTDAEIKAIVDGLEPRPMAMERVLMPQGERLAGEQLIALAYTERGGPKAETFGAIMARVSSSGRPLAQYGEAARWQEASSALGTTFETGDAFKAVYNDWAHRWSLAYFDPLQERATDYSRLDKARFAPVDAVMKRVGDLFPLRQRVLTEAPGTRLALGVMAFHRKNEKWPLALAAVRPAYVKEIDPDPFDPKKGEFAYFVPIRDQPRGERDLPKPHVISVGLKEIALSDQDRALDAIVAKCMEQMLTDGKTGLNALVTAVATNREDGAAMKALADAAAASVNKAKEFDKGLDPATRDRALEIFAIKSSAIQSKVKETGSVVAKDIISGKLPQKDAPAKIEETIEGMRRALRETRTSGSFQASLDDSTFVLYSVGSNQSRDWAKLAGQDGADLLIWPPVLSLARDMWAKQGTEPRTLAGAWLDYEPSTAAPAPPAAGEKKKDGTMNQPSEAPTSRPGRPGIPGG